MRRLATLVALILTGTMGTARASTITFEDLALDPPATSGGDRISGGFLFDTAADHSHLTIDSWGTSNGTHILVVENIFGPDAITFSPTSGGLFSLSSLDISEAGDHATFARKITITGTHADGTTISMELALDLNLVDGVLGDYFETFAFGAGWDNLSSVMLKGIDSTPLNGNYFAIDNVVVEEAPVPEPATLSLLGVGCAFVIRRRRRS